MLRGCRNIQREASQFRTKEQIIIKGDIMKGLPESHSTVDKIAQLPEEAIRALADEGIQKIADHDSHGLPYKKQAEIYAARYILENRLRLKAEDELDKIKKGN